MEPGYKRIGDWRVPREEYEEARESFSRRSKGSRARDKLARAPIEPDYETWERNQRTLDYPGVDTPTDTPRVGVLDAWWEETGRGGRGRGGAQMDPEPAEPWMGSRLLGGIERDSAVPPGALGLMRDAFRF